MYLDDKHVFHIVDDGKRFREARLVPGVSTKNERKSILDSWATIYNGRPNRMIVDKGICFGKKVDCGLFFHLAYIVDFIVGKTGIEAR